MVVLKKQTLEKIKARFSQMEHSWGTDDFTGKPGMLKDLAKEKEKRLKEYSTLDSTVFPILNTALVINWKWETAKKRIDRFFRLFPQINSLQKLNMEIERNDPIKFCITYLQINASSDKNPKYQLLRNLCQEFLAYQSEYNFSTEKEALLQWANNVDMSNLKNDPIGKLHLVGPAAVENLRMMMGIDVVKPDRHVLRVIKSEFGVTIDCDEFNDFAKALGVSPTYLDKVLYEYGRNK